MKSNFANYYAFYENIKFEGPSEPVKVIFLRWLIHISSFINESNFPLIVNPYIFFHL